MELRNIIVLTVILSFTLFYSCNGTSNNREADGQQSEQAGTSDEQDISEEQVQKIATAYLEIKNALVKTDGEAASKAAQQMSNILDQEKGKLGKIREDAERIAATTDTDQQREHLNTLSENVYAVIKNNVPGEMQLYRQYCPMAFNNKGAFWISAEREINNPYFGDKMLRCGSVKEEIE